MSRAYRIEDFRISPEYISFRVDGNSYCFKLAEISPRLAKASNEERNHYTISPSGYGIHWGAIDEDLSIEGLINQ